MNEYSICSFFGHRNVEKTPELEEKTRAEIEKIIKNGCHTFYFGGYGDFDDFCYQIVTQIKEERPDLKIHRIYCVSQEKLLRKSYHYYRKEDYDDVIYLEPSFNGWYKSIYYRNCAMIDNSDYIIFYCEERADSGAYKAYKYAVKQKKNVTNLF